MAIFDVLLSQNTSNGYSISHLLFRPDPCTIPTINQVPLKSYPLRDYFTSFTISPNVAQLIISDINTISTTALLSPRSETISLLAT